MDTIETKSILLIHTRNCFIWPWMDYMLHTGNTFILWPSQWCKHSWKTTEFLSFSWECLVSKRLCAIWIGVRYWAAGRWTNNPHDEGKLKPFHGRIFEIEAFYLGSWVALFLVYFLSCWLCYCVWYNIHTEFCLVLTFLFFCLSYLILQGVKRKNETVICHRFPFCPSLRDRCKLCIFHSFLLFTSLHIQASARKGARRLAMKKKKKTQRKNEEKIKNFRDCTMWDGRDQELHFGLFYVLQDCP